MGYKEIFDRVVDWLRKEDSSSGGSGGKKVNKFNLLIIIGSFGVLLMILANSFETPKPEVQILSGNELNQAEKGTGTSKATTGADIVTTENVMARSLEDILSQMDGVGQVKATVNLSSTMEYEYAINTSTNNKTTEERDQKGGNRTVTELNEQGQLVLVREGEGNKEIPVVRKEIKPQVQGVVVVAEGAENPETKAQLVEAVQVFLNISAHRVVVLPKEAGDQ